MNTSRCGFRVSTFCTSHVYETKAIAIRAARKSSRTHMSVIVTNEATRERIEF